MEPSDVWRRDLLELRKAKRLSRHELASRAEISAAIIRAYETGRRQPTRDTLDAILRGLDAGVVRANVIREAAGFARSHVLLADPPGYAFALEELPAAVERAPWPAFVTDNEFLIVAANRRLTALWQFDCERERAKRPRWKMNILAVLSEPSICSRICNWNGVLRLLVGLYKGLVDEDAPAPTRDFEAIIAQLTDHNPSVLTAMLDAWPEVRPVPPRVRWHYDVEWEWRAGRVLRFTSMVTTVNERDGLDFNDWIPMDEETWDAISSLADS